MRAQVCLGVVFLALSVTLVGCGGVSVDSVNKDIAALEADIPNLADAEKAKAFAAKAEAIANKIKSLPEDKRAEPALKLAGVQMKAAQKTLGFFNFPGVTIRTESDGASAPRIEAKDMKVPDIKLPDVKLPDVKFPDFKPPDIKLPD